MKYLLVILLLASFAGLEFFHELSNSNAPGAAVCMAPDSKADAIADTLFQHLHGH